LCTVQRWVSRAAGHPLTQVDWSDRPSGPIGSSSRTPRELEDLILELRRELREKSDLVLLRYVVSRALLRLHRGQKPRREMSTRCSSRRARRRVHPEVFAAEAFKDQEVERHHHERHMVVPPDPRAALEVVQSDLLLELLVVLLDPPPDLRPVHQVTEGRVLRQVGQPELGGPRRLLRPLDEQPLDRLGHPAVDMAVRRLHAKGGEGGS